MTEATALPPGSVVVTESHLGRFTQTVRTGSHTFAADEPASAGGLDMGPGPYDLLLAALGSCTAMTLRMYAERKGWALDNVEVRLRHGREHARDCAECGDAPTVVDVIGRDIVIEGGLDEAQRRRLMEIAGHCPVHRTLTGIIRVETRLVEGA